MIGWVETHGRAETEALVQGLPALPSREVVSRGNHGSVISIWTPPCRVGRSFS